MADHDFMAMPPVLHAVNAGAWAITSNTATGIAVPGEEPELTGMPRAGARTVQTFPAGVERGFAPTRSFADDFYYRIHLLPSIIDAGRLTEEMKYPVEIFNAFLEPVSLTELAAANAGGLELAGFAPSDVVLAMTSSVGTLTVVMDGPPEIDGSFAFEFTEGAGVTLRIIGSRVVTFPFAPDWSRKVVERISYLTDILEARDGTEQRIRMRALPRWSTEYTVLEGGEAMNLLDSMLAGWGARTFLVPVWWMKTPLVTPMGGGAVNARCDTAGRGFVQGGMAVVWQDAFRYEAFDIATIAPDGLTFSKPSTRSFMDGHVIPARMCRLAGAEGALSAVTSSLAEASFNFEAERPDDVPAGTSADTIDGRDVFPFRHDWSSPRKRTVRWSVNSYDTGTGLPIRAMRHGRHSDGLEARNALFGSIAEAEAFKGWVARQHGRAKSFYALIDEDQLVPTRGVLEGASLLYIRNAAYGLLESASDERNLLFMQDAAGARTVFRPTTYVDAGAGETLLYLDRPFPATVPLDRIVRIGFVVLCRFDQDDFALERGQDTLARTSLTLKGVPN